VKFSGWSFEVVGMAQNIPLIRVQEEWLPLPYENELFILSRKGVDCEIRNERFNQTCSDGSLVLTTQRLVFVHKQAQPQRPTMESFEAPLYGIWNEEFHQPILAANYLTCDVQPVSALLHTFVLPRDSRCSLTINLFLASFVASFRSNKAA
jgi:hypothetical protein